MPKPKNDYKVIMYASYPLKMKIGLYMQQKSIKSYSEFLRLATFFLLNNTIGLSPKPSIWDEKRKVITKDSILNDPIYKDKIAVMNELKELFAKGSKLLKKIE
ncbi:unnamed protein product [marine sediment metagenome]|uniref:Uncharacterized protein n=1 Tax=marine sediment metagenome TaxID=412755 RepID=X1D0Y8_9ZZZZ